MWDLSVDPTVVAVLVSMWVYFANKLQQFERRLTAVEERLDEYFLIVQEGKEVMNEA